MKLKDYFKTYLNYGMIEVRNRNTRGQNAHTWTRDQMDFVCLQVVIQGGVLMMVP